MLENLTPLNERELKEVSHQLLMAIDFVHGKGIIHCDLKLENVLLTTNFANSNDERLQVKLADFGLSHRVFPNSSHAYMSALCGTFGYIAPE